ncbi:MAG: hypothetical protein K5666_05185 [Bacilli bacterium]|nr:hypothetical protein [Bacilli bacterium]
MKKIVILILLSFFPIVGYADSEYINLECPSYSIGDTIECDLYTNVNYAIAAIEYDYSLPEQVSFIEFNKDDVWEGEQVGNIIYLYTSDLQIGKVHLGKIKIKINDSINNIDIKSNNLVYTDENFNDKKIDVNQLEKIEVKKNYNIYYVIIIIGIILIVSILLIIRRKKI